MTTYRVSEEYAEAAIELLKAMKEDRRQAISNDAVMVLGRKLIGLEKWAERDKVALTQ